MPAISSSAMAEHAAALFGIFRESEPEAFSLLSGLFLFSSFGLVVTEVLLSGLATVPEGAALKYHWSFLSSLKKNVKSVGNKIAHAIYKDK